MAQKLKAVGWSALYIAIAFASVFVLSFALGFVVITAAMLLGIIQPENVSNQMGIIDSALEYIQQGNALMMLNFAQELILFAGFGLWYYFREKKYRYVPDYKKAFQPKNLLSMAGIAFFGQYAVNLILLAIYLILPGIFEDYQELMKNLDIDAGNPVFMIFCVGIFGPLVEELLFRGMIFGKLRRTFSFWPSAAISAALFGIYHMNVVQGIYAFLFGMVFAYIFEKTETIWGCYLLHAFFNLSSYVISGYETALADAGFEIPIFIEIGICMVCVVLVYILLRRFGKRADRKKITAQTKIDAVS